MSLAYTYSAPNRERLVAEARNLFAKRGYADVSVDEIAAAANLTKGAVYYQFKDKTGLFKAACIAVLDDIAVAVNEARAELGTPRLEEFATGGPRMLDAYGTAEARRLLLMDAPVVLGFDGWMGLLEPTGICMVSTALDHWVAAGLLPAEQVPALSHLLFGAFIQGALRIAHAKDPATADREVRAAAETLIRGFMRGLHTAAKD
jgi:AcrR family transcriptional regulator